MNEKIHAGQGVCTIYTPKKVAEITICGVVHFNIDASMGFIRPTEAQIKNLKEMLCIDVKIYDEEEKDG